MAVMGLLDVSKNEQTVKKMLASKSHITLVSVLITLINIKEDYQIK